MKTKQKGDGWNLCRLDLREKDGTSTIITEKYDHGI